MLVTVRSVGGRDYSAIYFVKLLSIWNYFVSRVELEYSLVV